MEIKREEWHFPASNGEGDILARAWLTKNPQAIIQISHGMSEHSARYDDFACFLCSRGYSVVANDHAGHGHSAQGHLGSFSASAGGFDCSVEDLHRLFALAEEKIGIHSGGDGNDAPPCEEVSNHPSRREEPNTRLQEEANAELSEKPGARQGNNTRRGVLPRFLFGHSMGSILAALYANRYNDLTALIMSGTPSNIKGSRVFVPLAGIIAKTRGQLSRSPLLERLTGSAANLSLKEAMKAREWLTRDEEKVREFCLDPLCGFDYSAGGYHTLLTGYHSINSKQWGLHIPDIPILVVGGTDDSASDFGKGPAHYAERLKSTGHTQVHLKLFENCRHELINELNREEIHAYFCDWFTDKLWPTSLNQD